MMQPRIILLKEGTDTSQGKGQLISNINAIEAVTDILKTTLGPCGMDKLIHDSMKVTISNDGATIISLLDIVHPAAKTLVDIAQSQDNEVGDGTTSVCLLAGEMLKNVKVHVEDGIHPQIIMAGFRKALEVALAKLRELSIPVDPKDDKASKDMLLRCAGTALNSKLISDQKQFFSQMIVDAVDILDDEKDLKMIGIKKVPGGSVTDSHLVEGVAFKKTFAYAGFEQQPKTFDNPKIVALNVELELKNERQNAEIRIKDPAEYQSIVDAEWNIIYGKLDKIAASGAKVVLSRLPIGDLATQYFADRDIFCAGRVTNDDLDRTCMATGAVIQTSLTDLNDSILGTCAKFYEKQVGGERFNYFTGCPKTTTCTMILRGGSGQFIAESERSIHDAIMIVKRASQHKAVVAGGGAVEMELSRHVKAFANTLMDKRQLIVMAFAKAMEVIPRQVSDNAGLDATDIMNELRAAHARADGSGKWMGVDIENEGICNTLDAFVWEPTLVKLNALSAACEAACLVLSVDETVKNPKAASQDDKPIPQRGRGARR